VPAHTVSVYVEQGSSVEAGVNVSESPLVVHLPAAAGVSIGVGESEAGAPDRRTTSRAVPSATALEGSPVRRVAGAGLTGAGGVGAVGVAGVVDVVGTPGAVGVAGVLLARATLGGAIAARAHVSAMSALLLTDVKGSPSGGRATRLSAGLRSAGEAQANASSRVVVPSSSR
jgi:hypothetical protein